jgi:hypothetical protein
MLLFFFITLKSLRVPYHKTILCPCISALYREAVLPPEIYDVDILVTLSFVSVYESNLSFIVARMPLQYFNSVSNHILLNDCICISFQLRDASNNVLRVTD